VKDDLALAYSMLYDFKLGKLSTGAEITDEQINLICLLVKDLLPTQKFLSEYADQTLLKVAEADSYWNRITQELISQCYELRGKNKLKQIQSLKTEFAVTCPSMWYRNIVESI